MFTVRNLPSQLILAHAPWVLGGGLIVCIIACSVAGLTLLFSASGHGVLSVLIGIAIPLAIFALVVKRDQVVFDAAGGTVTLQRRTLLRYACQMHPLAQVRCAEVETFSDTARATLIFFDTTPAYPLVEAYISGNGPANAARTINDWLHATRKSNEAA